MKGVKAANSQIVTPLLAQKSVRLLKGSKDLHRPQRGQLFIAAALLPVELRPLRLMRAPQKGIKCAIQREGDIENSRAGRWRERFIQAAIKKE